MTESQPAPPRGVLITRPEDAAASTAARIAALGFEPVLASLLFTERRAVVTRTGARAVLVTSANALPSLGGLEHLPLLAVGGATAAAAVEAGFADVESAEGTARDLLALARTRLAPGTPILLASGAGQGAELAARLREAGFPVFRRVAYAARTADTLPAAAREALAAGRLRAALFLSAETARVFAGLLPAALRAGLGTVDALVIAPGVAAALAPLPFRQVRVSVGPTLDQVLDLL